MRRRTTPLRNRNDALFCYAPRFGRRRMPVGSFLVLLLCTVTTPLVSAQESAETDVAKAIAKGFGFLKSAGKNGKWEAGKDQGFVFENFPGGVTALVLHGLLDAGVKADDADVAKGLSHLRTLAAPEFTYVVSLQTQVFCRAGQKQDRQQIRDNVDRLIRNMEHDRDDKFQGWSYKGPRQLIWDHSNTNYAVLALHAAHQADVTVRARVWRDIQQLYNDSQLADGGWSYVLPPRGKFAMFAKSSLSMTIAGICGSLIAEIELTDKRKLTKSLQTPPNALRRLTQLFDETHAGTRYFAFHGIARLRQLSAKYVKEEEHKQIEKLYLKVVALLLKEQKENGSWHGDSGWDRDPVISTSLVLSILARYER